MKFKNWLAGAMVIIVFSCYAPKKFATPAMEIRNDTTKFSKSDALLTGLLDQYPQYFDALLKNNANWKIKIIYTQIDRKANNKPVFTNYYFNADPKQYIYPASTVKLPVAALALQRLNELKIPGLDKNTTMITEALDNGQTAIYNDPNSPDGRPTISNYIKRILLVSDNEAFNRLYEFLGQEYINNTLHQMGYDSTQIIHRLNVNMTEEQNRTTNPVLFYNGASKIIYQQPAVKSNLEYQPRKTFLGKGFYDGDQLINEPFNFSKKNRLSLVDLHSILISLIFPDAVPARQRFNLTPDDYHQLHSYMSMWPRESTAPQYDTSYNDAYGKFLLYGATDTVDNNIRIFNKEGDAYGFLTDAAYIVDFKNNIEFLLSASISCNSDGIYNDNTYEYETVGYPFMKHLGQVIYNYELGRKRKITPDLSEFKLDYGR